MADLGQLNEEDTWRFTFFLGTVMKVYDNAFFQYRLGMLIEERWQYFSTELLSVFQNPGARQWWKTQISTGRGFWRTSTQTTLATTPNRMTLELVLIPIFILMVASVPFLHMTLYQYLSGRLPNGDDPE